MRPMAYSTLTRLPNRTGLQSNVPTQQIASVNTILLQKRGLATAAEGAAAAPAEAFEAKPTGAPQDGPMREYDVRVEEGRLRDDPYQRGKKAKQYTASKQRSSCS